MYQQTCIPIAFDWLMSSRMTQPTKGGNAMEGVEVPWVRRRGPQTKAQGGTKGQTARIEKSNRSSYRQEKTHPGNCPSIQEMSEWFCGTAVQPEPKALDVRANAKPFKEGVAKPFDKMTGQTETYQESKGLIVVTNGTGNLLAIQKDFLQWSSDQGAEACQASLVDVERTAPAPVRPGLVSAENYFGLDVKEKLQDKVQEHMQKDFLQWSSDQGRESTRSPDSTQYRSSTASPNSGPETCQASLVDVERTVLAPSRSGLSVESYFGLDVKETLQDKLQDFLQKETELVPEKAKVQKEVAPVPKPRGAARMKMCITPQHFSSLGTTFRDVQVDFEPRGFTIRAIDTGGYAWTAFSKPLPGDIDMERCKFKIDPSGKEVAINLYKANADESWWSLNRIELERPYTHKAEKAKSLKTMAENFI
ncbi:unnamed protein product [Durusdinium trenchii]|uniref:CS domain-containing protein n=1 Tax=Durusdinium trenchii TaxID=1381693 RepID=A0ABP0J4L5_9DINO